MLLDDLVGVIEVLKERIATHGATLRENETRTRTALINPLLIALGWDVSDPALVTPEYRVGVSGNSPRADYALLDQHRNLVAAIEAKRLGESLENHEQQIFNYAWNLQIKYAGLTDGDRWYFVDLSQIASSNKTVLELSIASTQVHEAALKLLLLWRPNLASGRPVAASAPVLTAKVDDSLSVPVPMEDRSLPNSVDQISGHLISEPPVVSLPSITRGGWKPLSEIFPKISGDSPPSAIRLPDGNESSLRKAWSALVESTAVWLWSNELLTSSNVPVQSSSKRYIVNTTPSHPAGNEFNSPKKIVETPLWTEGNIGARAAVSNAKKLLGLCGVNPGTVLLRFE